ncbi:MAG TPA: hypothetical protein VM223_21790 [Planctomycetota bacterium]|nr:hypothetical protein [Planctomycetota bacterium]
MENLEGKIDRVRRRLVVIELAHAAVRMLFFLASAIAVLVLADKLVHLGWTVLAGACGLAGVGVLTWLAVTHRRVSAFYAAERIDSAFGLQERVSTAFAMRRAAEPMLPALLTDAGKHVDEIDPGRFRFAAPREIRWLPVPLLCIAALLFVPPVDLLGRRQQEERKKVEKAEVKKQAAHLQVKAQELLRRAERDKLPDAKKLAWQMQKLADELAKMPDLKKDAMLKMSKLSDEAQRLKEQAARAEKFDKLDFGKSEKLDGKIAELKNAQKAMRSLADALRSGDMQKASDAMKELSQKLQDGTLSDAEAKKLGEALQELAKSMPAGDQLSQDLQKLGDQLCKNGCKGAGQSLKQMKLTQQQMQELQKLMQQMAAADFAQDILDYERMCMSCSKPSGICKVCGMPMCGGCGTFACVCCPTNVDPADGGPCCRTCPGACGLGAGMAWQKGPRGGFGSGPRPLAPPGPVNTKDSRAPSKVGEGKILATQFLRGMPPDDAQAKMEYQQVLDAAQKDAEDAISREDIPPEYREKIKEYFEDLKEK